MENSTSKRKIKKDAFRLISEKNYKMKYSKKVLAFKSGYEQLRKNELKVVRLKIMDVLGIKTSAAFYNRLRGMPTSKAEIKAIEEIFKQHRITKDIWREIV